MKCDQCDQCDMKPCKEKFVHPDDVRTLERELAAWRELAEGYRSSGGVQECACTMKHKCAMCDREELYNHLTTQPK